MRAKRCGGRERGVSMVRSIDVTASAVDSSRCPESAPLCNTLEEKGALNACPTCRMNLSALAKRLRSASIRIFTGCFHAEKNTSRSPVVSA